MDSITDTDIPWHIEPFSYRTTRPLTAGQLWTLTLIEDHLRSMSEREKAAWILDEIHSRLALERTIHAAMDAIFHLQKRAG